jgi:hypothetical protein
MPERLATFRGVVSCVRARDVPGLTLTGNTAEAPDEPSALAFSTEPPAGLPATLQDALVERLGDGRYRIGTATGEWLLPPGPVHLHREIAARFYQAIPPRPAPWTKRVFWRVVLTIAGSRAGLATLRRLRG